MTVAALLVALGLGVATGWLLARRAPGERRPGPEPGLVVSSTTLDWLRRAVGARAAWAVLPYPGEAEPAWLGAEEQGLPEEERAALVHRVREAAAHARPVVERFEAGTLVVHAQRGAASAVLLPRSAGAGAAQAARGELEALLQALERQPRLAAVARADDSPGRLESLESVAHRLAFELEAATGGDCVVAVQLAGGPCILGLGGAADPRLEGELVGPDTVLGRFISSGAAELETVEPPLDAAPGERRQGARAALLLPLEEGGTRLGAVVLWPLGGRLPPTAFGAVREALRRAGPRVSRAREAHELRNAALRDALTGLANRRRLELAMHDIAVEQGALVLLDLDHFKKLNDTLGHPAGDAALVHVAGIVRHAVRRQDVVARVGGEEFAIWLPGATLAAGTRLAERVREQLAVSGWAWQGRAWPLTASIGVAHWPETSQHVDNLAAQADAALYAAKQGGRNRVVQSAG